MLYIGGLNYRQRNEAKQNKTQKPQTKVKAKGKCEKQKKIKYKKKRRYVCKFDSSNKINNQIKTKQTKVNYVKRKE